MAECKLTDRIVIKKVLNQNIDDEGNYEEVFEEYYRCWSSFTALSGKKFAERNATEYKRLDSFVVRFCNKTKQLLDDDYELYRIIHKNNIYKLNYAYDIKNQHNFIDLECELVK